MRTSRRVMFAILVAAASGVWSAAHGADSVADALATTRPIIDLRLRPESVDQDGTAKQARAVTLRGRIGAETGEVWGSKLLAEAELVWPLEDDYNDTINGKTLYPVVADPESYEINRLQLANSSLPDTILTLGRQRIAYDDHRFIGNVGWRQNEQTFDALRVTNKSLRGLTVDLAYLNQVNRIVGPDSPVGRYEGDSYLANLSYALPLGTLTGFVYVLDLEQAAVDSSATAGLRYAAEKSVGAVRLAGFAAYAEQRDHASNPLDYREPYWAAELSGTARGWTVAAGTEVLGGDGSKGFATPLATLHRFQGWADKFLTAPPDGIDDRYASVTYARKPAGVLDSLSMSIVYHRFEAERVSLDYGSETDVLLQAQWRRFTGAVKYADYRSDGFATDTQKFWIQIEFAH